MNFLSHLVLEDLLFSLVISSFVVDLNLEVQVSLVVCVRSAFEESSDHASFVSKDGLIQVEDCLFPMGVLCFRSCWIKQLDYITNKSKRTYL